MAIGTPVSMGLTQSTGVTQLVLTTTSTANATDMIFVVGEGNTSSTGLSTLVDSGAVNSYTIVSDPNAQSCSYGFVSNAASLASGGTITANFNGASASHMLGALHIPGVAKIVDPRDTAIAVVSATGTSNTSVSTPVLKQPDNIAIVLMAFSGTITAFTPPAGWTSIIPEDVNIGAFRLCYQITTTNAAVTFGAASWTTSRTWRIRLLVFKGISPLSPSLNMVGVGF